LADVKNNPQVRLGVVAGETSLTNAQGVGIPDSQITQFPDHQSLTAGLQAGRIDAASVASSDFSAILKIATNAEPVTNWVDPVIKGKPAVSYGGFIFNKADKQLRDAVNQQVDAMIADGTVATIRKSYGLDPVFESVANAPTLQYLCDPNTGS
jgi:polar amino acid transport system substrate-binding protein